MPRKKNRVHKKFARVKAKDERQESIDSGIATVGPAIRMLQTVYQNVMEQLIWNGTELGGMLIGPCGTDLITHYLPDEDAEVTAGTYTINHRYVNHMLRSLYGRVDCDLKGIVHMHPPGICHPSGPDIEYLTSLFSKPENADASLFSFPIVCGGQFYPYVFRNGQDLLHAELILV